LTSLWLFATIAVHAQYDVKDFPRVRKIGFSLGRLIIPTMHITPCPCRFTPPPTSPKAESDDETQAPNYSLDPRAGPFYSPSEGRIPPGVLARVTITLSHYPGGDLIETPEFVQNVTPTDVLDLTEFLQDWGGPHLYYHDSGTTSPLYRDALTIRRFERCTQMENLTFCRCLCTHIVYRPASPDTLVHSLRDWWL